MAKIKLEAFAMIDNQAYQDNDLNIDPYSITWRRVIDVNDREVRNIYWRTFNGRTRTVYGE